jgi:hypothetical protein
MFVSAGRVRLVVTHRQPPAHLRAGGFAVPSRDTGLVPSRDKAVVPTRDSWCPSCSFGERSAVPRGNVPFVPQGNGRPVVPGLPAASRRRSPRSVTEHVICSVSEQRERSETEHPPSTGSGLTGPCAPARGVGCGRAAPDTPAQGTSPSRSGAGGGEAPGVGGGCREAAGGRGTAGNAGVMGRTTPAGNERRGLLTPMGKGRGPVTHSGDGAARGADARWERAGQSSTDAPPGRLDAANRLRRDALRRPGSRRWHSGRASRGNLQERGEASLSGAVRPSGHDRRSRAPVRRLALLCPFRGFLGPLSRLPGPSR